MLIFENVLFVVLFQNVAKSVGRALGFLIEKRWARSSLTETWRSAASALYSRTSIRGPVQSVFHTSPRALGDLSPPIGGLEHAGLVVKAIFRPKPR